MNLSGEDAAQAVREWLKEEVKNAAKTKTDLGKFFFGVSTGTIGLLASLEKLSTTPCLSAPLGASLVVLVVSAVVALIMALPKVWGLKSVTNVFDLYNEHVDGTKRFAWWWFTLWLVGVLPGLYAVLFG